jgi:hypothetical protein
MLVGFVKRLNKVLKYDSKKVLKALVVDIFVTFIACRLSVHPTEYTYEFSDINIVSYDNI